MAALTVGTPPGLPADVDLRIRQGSDVYWAFRYFEQTPAGDAVPNTYTNWAARYQLRDQPGGDVWLSGSSPDDGLELAVEDGKLKVSGHIPHATTQASEWSKRIYGVWDVELVRGDGSVIPLAAGRVFVTHDVTRDA